MTATLDFIIGRAGTGKTHACLDAMRQRMAEAPMGPALILLLPEHMTFKVERELAASIPKGSGFLRSYVFGFRRFARHVLLETGHMKVPRISDVGRRLLLRKILVKHQKEKDLDVFARAVRQRGFTESLSDAIQEFKSYRLTTDVLREAAEELAKGNERLAGKLQEMALLTDEFAAEMQGKANDAEDMMNQLAEAILEAPLLNGAEVWLDGFIFFNPQEMAVLRALLMTAAKVHVALPMAGISEGEERVRLDLPENLQETALFNRPYRTLQAIRRMAREELGYRGAIPIHLLAEQHRFAPASILRGMEQDLFRYGGSARPEDEGMQLVEAANRRLEVESAAADILRLVRDEGWHYRELGILVRDSEAYGDLVRLVFEDYGIPFFEDSKRPSIHHRSRSSCARPSRSSRVTGAMRRSSAACARAFPTGARGHRPARELCARVRHPRPQALAAGKAVGLAPPLQLRGRRAGRRGHSFDAGAHRLAAPPVCRGVDRAGARPARGR